MLTTLWEVGSVLFAWATLGVAAIAEWPDLEAKLKNRRGVVIFASLVVAIEMGLFGAALRLILGTAP